MSANKLYLSFEVDRELYEFLKWYAEEVCKKKQKELVNEILNGFKETTLDYMNEIAKIKLEQMGIGINEIEQDRIK